MTLKSDQTGIYGPSAGRRTPGALPAQGATPPSSQPTRPNAYLQTRVMTSSPAELRLMLIDGAIRNTQKARTGVANHDHELAFTGFSKARAIVTELIAGLNPDVSPELCEQLMNLYTFVFTRLIEASSCQSVPIIDEVLQLLQFERDTWSMLVEDLASENASAALVGDLPVATPPTMDDQAGTGSSLPTGGRISATG